ncbi:ATP-grasp domain-containing protein [Novosphingobium panipatense]|uniref:Carbamoyl-phosphate synthase large subunit n=1 Tax=Novosphingobium panipatense TaxID=428991 RepID=A0ABY1QIA3_9SPHN|nr:ATP-grasp domain-containing protein [Novosphingobium panipatense]SMP71824.1 carbamoyl-phosphate synthase large subunit [Novosphingobium panipatense]
MRTLRILFTSAGRRVELINCFREAAEKQGFHAEIHACDLMPELSAACLSADISFAVPRCTDPGYVTSLLDYCSYARIDLLVPTIDTELEQLAHARSQFAQIGTEVHISSPATIDIVRDKELTVEVLRAMGVPVPRTSRIEKMANGDGCWEGPFFVKPVAGSASRGIAVLEGPHQIRNDYEEPMLAQELLRGDEYTVNIYLSDDGVLLSAVPHRRLSIRAGEVEKGRTVRETRFIEIAEKVAKALPGARGALCFQLIDDPSRGPCVFEINARFGGGYPLADRAGGRFAESLIARLAGRGECATMDWREDVVMLRYDSAIFHDRP